MMTVIKNLITPIILLVVFFALLFAYTTFVGPLNISAGNQNFYSSFSATGESTIKNVDPNLSDVSPLEQTARVEAYNNAAAIAQQLATLSGRKLGALTSISEYIDRNPQTNSADMSASMPASATTSSSLKVSITLTYQLK